MKQTQYGKNIDFGTRASTETSEALTTDSWEQSLPLPLPLTVFCTIQVNNTHILVTGGRNVAEVDQDATYFWNIATSKWTTGPKLMNVRSYHSCSKIKSSQWCSKENGLVVGGLKNGGYVTEVEILSENGWQSGPTFPQHGAIGAVAITDPLGGVIVIGGDSLIGRLNKLYRLAHAEAKWELLPQTLSIARAYHVAFLIPDELANCTSQVISG